MDGFNDDVLGDSYFYLRRRGGRLNTSYTNDTSYLLLAIVFFQGNLHKQLTGFLESSQKRGDIGMTNKYLSK